MAEKIAEGIQPACDFTVDVCDIENMHPEKLEEKIAHSTAIIVGSPTINQNIVSQIYQLFAAINPIRDRGKLAAAFGSFGWSGESIKIIESNLANLKLKLFDRHIKVKFKPHEKDFEECREFGRAFAEQLIEKNKLVCDV